MHYRFYILDRDGSFLDVAEALCANDAEASTEAQQLLGRAPAVEVWQQGRFVGQIGRPRAA